MTTLALRTTKIWADTIRSATCKSPRCGKRIFFAQNVRTGNDMPFDVRPVALSVQPELETNREMWLVDLAANHFATCVSAPQFRRAR